ncbi:MAG: hypothetical protein HRU15_16345 [Planctomycetes bacterium]|nr:hypothetical protein [Planctomycetota bacterium]
MIKMTAIFIMGLVLGFSGMFAYHQNYKSTLVETMVVGQLQESSIHAKMIDEGKSSEVRGMLAAMLNDPQIEDSIELYGLSDDQAIEANRVIVEFSEYEALRTNHK